MSDIFILAIVLELGGLIVFFLSFFFLFWSGRHPCLGMKIATLELKMIVAQFVIGYEYDVVDANGKLLAQPPLVDYNAQLQVRSKLISKIL